MKFMYTKKEKNNIKIKFHKKAVKTKKKYIKGKKWSLFIQFSLVMMKGTIRTKGLK